MPKLFCLSTIPTQSGEPLCYDQGRVDRKRVAYRAVSNLVSITFLNALREYCVFAMRGFWVLWWACRYQDLLHSFVKYWTVWFKSYSILKMRGIDWSFILYHNFIQLWEWMWHYTVPLHVRQHFNHVFAHELTIVRILVLPNIKYAVTSCPFSE